MNTKNKNQNLQSQNPQSNNQKLSPWIVHKFGGTSVGSVDAFKKVLQIINQEPAEQVAIVVSAMSGVTDRLIKAANMASEQSAELYNHLELLFKDHFRTAQELLPAYAAAKINEKLGREIQEIHEILRGVWLSKHLPESTHEMVSGYGELWSSRILCELWKTQRPHVEWVDARNILVVENGETGPLLQWDICQKNIEPLFKQKQCLVITGFIASTPKGVSTTLKRNGSDFSASIFGKLLKSREVVIWTDVDGVYSADPRKVPEAECLKELSYEEAIELAYFGAKVIHPHTMGPAVELNIPIRIKNTFNPSAMGTVIHHIEHHTDGRVARGFTTVDQVSLINVEGTGMIGVPGVAQRLFGALREVGVSVMLISQASSEHSICFAIPMAQSKKAHEAIEKTFYSELAHHQIERVQEISPCSILAMVGDNMVEKSGVAGRFFSSLGAAKVSVRAIAQGSSERNISVVVDQANAAKALRATHSAFFLSDYTLSVGVIGAGLIGKAFIQQIQDRKDFLKQKFNLDVRIRAAANSREMFLDNKEIQMKNKEFFNSKGEKNSSPLNLNQLVEHIQTDSMPHQVLIDCTSNQEISNQYDLWMKKGIHIITPNKKAGSGALTHYQEIKRCEEQFGSLFLYEATVGAGLPIISTLRDLIQTGDEILSIEGVLSGTLSYLMNHFNGEKSFSQLVLEAKAKGYTEPDPRDDLNGMDVGRKVVILAREAGIPMSLEEMKIDSLVPEALMKIQSKEEFLSRISELDQTMEKLLKSAQAQNKVLRYTGFVDQKGTAKVGLREVDVNHPLARVQGTDNIILIRTQRYNEQPLIVQGPGAGPEVTAGGIFADLLRLARVLGAKT